MSETPSVRRAPLDTLAILLSSMLIAFPALVSAITKGVLFAGNPAKVDITNGLAYLRELLGFGFGALGLIVVAIVVVYVLVYRRARTLDALKLPFLILVVQVVAGVVILAFTALSNNAHDSYVGALLVG